jgi:prepilin-type N-terminal cleavage/methylation domain-containing protein
MDVTGPKVSRRFRNVIDGESATSAGFSLIELLVVVAIFVVVAALAVPNLIRAGHAARLRGAGSDFASLLQQARIRAIQDDRFYSVYCTRDVGCQQTDNSPAVEFVDIYPQNINGASGSGGTTVDPNDPSTSLAPEIMEQPQSQAPNTPNLLQQVLGGNPSNLTPVDGSSPATPVTFGPQGLPCIPVALTGGTVCNSRGGPVAYWVFFQNNVTQDWEAVTITPAGRLQKWAYSAGAWQRL